MNDFTQPVTQEELDRMVDGELSVTEQQTLLGRLDESADDWKRLALAYAEAQAWQGTMRETVAAADVVPVPTSSSADPTPLARRRFSAQRVVVALALLISGFGLGVWTIGSFEPAETPRIVVTKRPVLTEQPGTSTMVAATIAPTADAVADDKGSPQDVPPVDEPSVVQFVVHDGRSDEAQVVSVPFRDESVPLDEVFSVNDSSVSPQLREVLRQTGHEIVEEQGFLPLALPDGRQVVFPVNQIRVMNGARIYQ